MSVEGVQELAAGPVRFVVQYRQTQDDEGPSVRVLGTLRDATLEVLRFDCFANDPHYHYDPDGKDEQHHMRDESIENPVEWTLHRLERDLADMIRRAGYGTLADRVDPAQVAAVLPAIREAMTVPVA